MRMLVDPCKRIYLALLGICRTLPGHLIKHLLFVGPELIGTGKGEAAQTSSSACFSELCLLVERISLNPNTLCFGPQGKGSLKSSCVKFAENPPCMVTRNTMGSHPASQGWGRIGRNQVPVNS